MKNFSIRFLLLGLSTFAITGCETPYGLLAGPVPAPGGAGAAATPDPGKVICDPLDPSNQSDPTLGMKASLYYIENFEVGGAYPVTTNEEFLTKGKKVDAELFLSSMSTTPKRFDVGFTTNSG